MFTPIVVRVRDGELIEAIEDGAPPSDFCDGWLPTSTHMVVPWTADAAPGLPRDPLSGHWRYWKRQGGDLVECTQEERDALDAEDAAKRLASEQQNILMQKEVSLQRKFIREVDLATLRGTDDALRLETLIKIVAGKDYKTRIGYEGI